jgi:hypothetical protein
MLSPRLNWPTPHAVLTVNYTHYVGPRCFRPRANPDIMPAERGRSVQHEPTFRVVATEATSERSSHQRHFFWTTLELCCTFLDELTSLQTATLVDPLDPGTGGTDAKEPMPCLRWSIHANEQLRVYSTLTYCCPSSYETKSHMLTFTTQILSRAKLFLQFYPDLN